MRVFAVMRQTHEAIRDGPLTWAIATGSGMRCAFVVLTFTTSPPPFRPSPGLKDIEEATDALQTAGAAGDVYTLQAAFEGLMRMVKLHMRQEEEVRRAGKGRWAELRPVGATLARLLPSLNANTPVWPAVLLSSAERVL